MRTAHVSLYEEAKKCKTLQELLKNLSEADRKRLEDLGVLKTEHFGGKD